MARANTYTLLSLDRYAQVMGINPAHFNQSYAPSINPAVFPLNNACSDIFYQYDWQTSDQMSRETLAQAIYDAEMDIAKHIHYFPAPIYIEEDEYEYPRHYYRAAYGNGLDIRGKPKSIPLRYQKFAKAGRRATTLIGTASTGGGELVYQDNDGDGLSENAQITLPTTLTDSCEIKVYTTGKNAVQTWEVRPVTNKTISAGNVVINIPSWQLINPELWEQFPVDGGENATIDISTTVNFVDSVEVYREFTDFTQPSVQFLWERNVGGLIGSSPSFFFCDSCGGIGCELCTYLGQDGCVHARNKDKGEVVPLPAIYDVTNERWNPTTWAECREPDLVRFWYLSGEVSNDFRKKNTCDPLSDWWANTISWLATARLHRPFCSCVNVSKRVEDLQRDLARSGGKEFFLVGDEILSNPFGTQKGAAMAWKRISLPGVKKMKGGIV